MSDSVNMNSKRLLALALITLSSSVACDSADSQPTLKDVRWLAQQSGVTVSLRGISVVSRDVVWACGENGTYVRSTDGGETWTSGRVPGAEGLDFRDVEAIDKNAAYLMSAGKGEKSRIYKTTDGGQSWALQYIEKHPEGFLNGFAFWDRDNGIAVGDPVEGRLLIISTRDGGETWHRLPPENIPPALDGEVGFAASGTSIAVEGKENAWIGTGGAAARVFRSTDGGRTWAVTVTPIVSGTESSGIFSLAFRDSNNGVAVGGDYRKPRAGGRTVAVTTDGGATWSLTTSAQTVEYRSCVTYVRGATPPLLLVVGPTGSDFSTDNGRAWVRIGNVGFHTTDFGDSMEAGWAAGPGGGIAKLKATVMEE